LSQLSTLTLNDTRIGTGGAHALLTTHRLPALHCLRLGHNHITQFLRLDEARMLRRLRTLTLNGNGLDSAGIAPLVESPHAIGLQSLDLSHNALGDAGAEVLARSPSLAGLRTLLLSDNRITDAGVRILASSPNLSGLTALKLSNNLIGDAGIQALVDSPFLQRVSRLVSAEV
jgi:Leucine-rich repeat (LRR) protein